MRKKLLNNDIKATVIRLLANREHSLKELKDKLNLRGYDPIEIATILEFVIQYDLQSEIRYIDMVIRSRASKGFGPSYITAYLQQKGVKSELIQLALAETDFNWDEILKQVLMKKYGSAKISYSDQSARIFLQNRGFSYSQFEKYLSD